MVSNFIDQLNIALNSIPYYGFLWIYCLHYYCNKFIMEIIIIDNFYESPNEYTSKINKKMLGLLKNQNVFERKNLNYIYDSCSTFIFLWIIDPRWNFWMLLYKYLRVSLNFITLLLLNLLLKCLFVFKLIHIVSLMLIFVLFNHLPDILR